jgi:hypothetical protein
MVGAFRAPGLIMHSTKQVFHLAVPCKDLEETAQFYDSKLNCRIARRYDDRVTVDFFGDQVVFHLCPDEIAPEPKLYPRHFGVTFEDRDTFDGVLRLARDKRIPFFKEPFERFSGKRERHLTFVLVDPSNNLIEFKWYPDPEMMY